MTDSLWGWGLAEFRDRTASTDPTPGGGSAAMVSAAIGMGLVLMALRVTEGKVDDPASLAPLIAAGDRLLAELSGHADADVAVFSAYLAALKLPRGSDEEKAARRAALAEAAVAATEAPLNAAQSVLESLDLARQAAAAADRGILSDVAAGAALLNGAVAAVLYNVDINLKSVKDADTAADFARSRKHLASAAETRHASIVALVEDRLA